MLTKYDPLRPPDPHDWLSMDEVERIDLVRRYHRRAKEKLPNARLHATLHVIVENQAALADEIPVQSTIARLMREGLDRHEAIHAVAQVWTMLLWDVESHVFSGDNFSPEFCRRLPALTAEKWRNQTI